MIVQSICDLIGDTPLMEISRDIHQLQNIRLYCKLELLNPFGSIKDRIALSMLSPVLSRLTNEQSTVVENSSGNTAKALQGICNINGIKFSLISGLTRVREQKEILKLMGATIEEVPNASDCFDPNDPNDPQYLIEQRIAAEPGHYFFTSQFTNPENPKTHREKTGTEILADLNRVDCLYSSPQKLDRPISLGLSNDLDYWRVLRWERLGSGTVSE
jgi:cysteine synthase B